MKKINSIVLMAMLLSATFVGCKDDDEDPVVDGETTKDLTLNIAGLEDLGPDHMYEGWIIVDGTPISTGLFSVDSEGTPSQTTFSLPTEQVDAATKYVITVEPSPDSDPAPSDQKLIAGDFSGTTATMSTSTAPAIGDFSSAAGIAFLRTPTDETDSNNGNDESGIWFGTPGMPPTAGLELPTLPEGWVYEGWVIGETGPISTGTFTAFDEVDSGNPYSGIENNVGPPIPGEDFLREGPAGETFPLDVRGRRAVISIEPYPDNLPGPFLLKPLLLNVPEDAAFAPATHAFEQYLSTFPTGTVTR